MPRNIKILNINCQSVSAKKDKFLTVIEDENPDIVVGTESWLTPNHYSGEIFPQQYQVFRKDRKSDAHGGVFIATKLDLVALLHEDLSHPNSELLWVQLQCHGGGRTIIGAFYRSQQTDEAYIETLRSSLEKIPVHDNIWLLGDFNLPDVDWTINRFQPSGRYPTQSKAMVDVALDYGLQQLVDRPTRGENLLELFFTNKDSLVQHANVKPGISNRDYVEKMCDIKPARVKSPPRKVFLWKKANYQAISDGITVVDARLNARPHPSCPEDVDANWNLLHSTLLESIERNVPSKMTTNKFSQPLIDTTIRRGIRKKRKLFRKARKSNSVTDWVAFRNQRRKLDRQIRSKHREYMTGVIGASLETSNTKPFWNYVKSRKLDSFGISPQMTSSGNLATSPKHKANVLNQQFQSVFSSENTQELPRIDDLGIPNLPPLMITEPGVYKLLTDLKEQKASGPDGVPARVLKHCADSAATVLQKIFQASIDNKYLPQDWRKANVTPIYKKGDKSCPANYRPLSLTSIPCKVLEHIYHHIFAHIDLHDLLSDAQHGFR